MTNHIRTEKIGGDSIFIFGSGKPLWQLGDSIRDLRELGQYWVIRCLSCCFACLIYLFSFCDIFVASFIYFNNCGVIFCLLVNKSLSHTLTCILHKISSIPELCPFRRKCWLRSREIIISTMASQTLPEFMVLVKVLATLSWDNNLHNG